MRLTFTRSTQEEADALRALLEETVKNEKTGYGNRDDAFEVTASAVLQKYGVDSEKRWEFQVAIQESNKGDDDHVQHFRWAKLFERLINRPAVKRGTKVRIARNLTDKQWAFVTEQGGNFVETITEYLKKNADRHLYRDSEDHYVKATEIAFELEIDNNEVTLVVDAVDAPIVDHVLQTTVDDIERDRERAHPSGTAGGGT